MKSLKEFIKIQESEDAVASIEKDTVENPKTVTLMDVKESPLNWKKIAKLTPEKFYEVFKDKTLVIFSPIEKLDSFYQGGFVWDVKHSKPNTTGMTSSIILISNISDKKCNVLDVSFERTLWSSPHKAQEDSWDPSTTNNNINVADVIKGISSFGLEAFTKSTYQPKIFIIDGSYDMKKDSKFVKQFFKPYLDATERLDKAYYNLLDALEKVYSKNKIDLNTMSHHWNYVVKLTNWTSKYNVAIVGLDKAIFIGKNYAGIPQITYPGTVSSSYFTDHADRDYNEGYKITDEIYDQLVKMVEDGFKNFDGLRKEAIEFENNWIKKYVLGKPIDIKKDADANKKEIEKNGNKNPEENNDPDSGSPKVRTTKKKLIDAEVKMDAWHKGTRKQNLKNCSDEKLKMNYQICKSKGYDKEADQIETEAKARNLKLSESFNKSWFELASKIVED